MGVQSAAEVASFGPNPRTPDNSLLRNSYPCVGIKAALRHNLRRLDIEIPGISRNNEEPYLFKQRISQMFPSNRQFVAVNPPVTDQCCPCAFEEFSSKAENQADSSRLRCAGSDDDVGPILPIQSGDFRRDHSGVRPPPVVTVLFRKGQPNRILDEFGTCRRTREARSLVCIGE